MEQQAREAGVSQQDMSKKVEEEGIFAMVEDNKAQEQDEDILAWD